MPKSNYDPITPIRQPDGRDGHEIRVIGDLPVLYASLNSSEKEALLKDLESFVKKTAQLIDGSPSIFRGFARDAVRQGGMTWINDDKGEAHLSVRAAAKKSGPSVEVFRKKL